MPNPTHKKRKPKRRTPKAKQPTRFDSAISWLGLTRWGVESLMTFLRTVLALFCLFSFLFMLSVLLMYVKDAAKIYSITHNIGNEAVEHSGIGVSGAIVGETLFNNLFGWASFSFIFLFLIVGIALLWLKAVQAVQVLGRLVQVLILTMGGALVFASLQSWFGSPEAVFNWGGELGNLYRDTISHQIGFWGLLITVVFTLLIIAMTFSRRVLFFLNTPPQRPDISAVRFGWSNPFKGLVDKLKRRGDEQEEDEYYDDEEDEDDEEEDTTEPTEPQDEVFDDSNFEDEPPFVAPLSPSSSPQAKYADETKHEGELIVEVAQTDDLVDVEEHSTYTPGLSLAHYHKPSIDLLRDYGTSNVAVDKAEIEETKQKILDTLASFKIHVIPQKATVGPTVTLYEVIPDQGIKVARISGLVDDLALALKSEGIRIIAPMPGQGTVGIEVPNSRPQTVSMRSIIASRRYNEELEKMELPVGIGKTITNEPFVFDLAKMPHLLIAGATGQGKSVGLNAMITSLLYSKRPEELKFVMVDPKMLEFSLYEELENHFMAMLPDAEKAIITDMSLVVPTLNSLCIEMDKRYDLLTRARVRSIIDYNKQVREGKLSRLDGFEFLPYIVLIVDEFADLIMTRGKEVEQPIARLAQKARAAGIHMVIATQRPSTDVITGLIKANFPARIAFKVFSMVDSRTILDSPGANQLIGRGDMLFYQGKEMVRVQCAFMDTPETEEIVRHINGQESEGHAYILPEYVPEGDSIETKDFNPKKKDALFEDAARLVVNSQVGSASIIQRKMEVGFARAGRIVDQLEAAGILGPQRGSKPREILVQDPMALEELLERLRS